MKYCRILLKPLSQKEEEKGYSQAGLKQLSGLKNFNPMLNFNRQHFSTSLPKIQKGMSISGYQPKLQMTLVHNQFDIVDAKGDFILKPSPEAFPYLAENEHATMAVMKALKFNVPDNGLFPFQDSQEYAFAIRRYDRIASVALHQEQLDGAMGIRDKYGKIGSDNEKYVSYEQAVKFILNAAKDTLALKTELFRRVVYAYLLGNNDLHLRNFSLIYDKHSISLAPVYDFVSVRPYPHYFNEPLALPLLAKEEGGKELAGGFETQYGTYLGMDFIEFGENIGLNPKLAQKLLQDLLKEQNKVIDIYQRSFMPQADIESLLSYYQQRLHYLQIFDEPRL